MAFQSITIQAGGISVGVKDYPNSVLVNSFANSDYIVRFFGGKTFTFPAATRYKGRVIILVNKQTAQSITVYTPSTDASGPVTIPPGGKLHCHSDGDLWLL